MIEELRLFAFKRFEVLTLKLAPLTVLTGLNGSGKTSVIQSLLLLAEAQRGGRRAARLNGPFGFELGTADDVRNWRTDGLIEIGVTSESASFDWVFKVPSGEALFLSVVGAPDDVPIAYSSAPRALTYLCADRLGPRASVVSSALPAEDLEVGSRGENCAQMLAILGNSRPFTGRSHPDDAEGEPTLFKYEVERWMSEITRPIEIDAEQFSGAMVSALRFRQPGGDWVRAPNMGYGVSYALPIVVGGLAALEGGLLLVENPEAHLHPAGQSRIGVFLAWLSSQGVQVVVETHSDHVLNGMRLAIAKFRYTRASDAIVHYFDEQESLGPTVERLLFSETGSVSNWPSGFFDQYQLDVAALGRIRRKG
ncbi:DUF3696 domain-containing protein [Frateuria sp. GZRR35]|uniref:AAA family ATPase n=1 Tax=Frateuria sp. GZRR35 TaxID=3351536 RepID=UPI003EDBA822